MVELVANDIILRFALAAFLGSLIGLEREVRRLPAGLKTHALVCLGSCIFTVTSILFSNFDPGKVDVSRIAAQIVTGVGFLGAGVIFLHKDRVYGLTTAANIWVVASLGLLIGMGEYVFAVAAALIIYAVLIVGGLLERSVLHKKKK